MLLAETVFVEIRKEWPCEFAVWKRSIGAVCTCAGARVDSTLACPGPPCAKIRSDECSEARLVWNRVGVMNGAASAARDRKVTDVVRGDRRQCSSNLNEAAHARFGVVCSEFAVEMQSVAEAEAQG